MKNFIVSVFLVGMSENIFALRINDVEEISVPQSSAEFSLLMKQKGGRNTSLLQYLYPPEAELTKDIHKNWVGFTEGCSLKDDCFCFHVTGDMSKSVNPDGYKKCLVINGPISGCQEKTSDCSCLSGPNCLFSDMRPAKILAAITAARHAGVTHIIEEGRFGGLSAYEYAFHGFKVTSVEFLPLDGPTHALSTMNRDITLLNGDGSVLLPNLTSGLSRHEAAKTMVIFDGEKRLGAWKTFSKIRKNVAFAIFDDTNLGSDGQDFMNMLQEKNEVYWDTRDRFWKEYIDREIVPISNLKALNEAKHRFMGGINELQKFHFTIVKGGAWGAQEEKTSS